MCKPEDLDDGKEEVMMNLKLDCSTPPAVKCEFMSSSGKNRIYGLRDPCTSINLVFLVREVRGRFFDGCRRPIESCPASMKPSVVHDSISGHG